MPHEVKSAQWIAVAALAAGPVLACTRESSHGPVQWTASNPSSPVGQTAAQAWSRSTSSDRPEFARGPQAPPGVTSAQTGALEDASELPPVCEPVLGVTSEQPPSPKWPYSGVTLQLEPMPP